MTFNDKLFGPILESSSNYFRKNRDMLLKKIIVDQRSRVSGVFRIVDFGGTLAYWRRIGADFLIANDIEVTCINLATSELGSDDGVGGRLVFKVGDACHMVGHCDNSFDLVHSNSVIEHVGQWSDMRNFAAEIARLAPAYYVQTPYFWFPVDPHFYRVPFFHWLPVSLRLKLLRRIKVGWSAANPDINVAMGVVFSAILLDATQYRALFPDARIVFERVALLPKSLIAIRAL